MDPDNTYAAFQLAIIDRDWYAAVGHAQALGAWLARGGRMPGGMDALRFALATHTARTEIMRESGERITHAEWMARQPKGE